jgi:hypothetical protein
MTLNQDIAQAIKNELKGNPHKLVDLCKIEALFRVSALQVTQAIRQDPELAKRWNPAV